MKSRIHARTGPGLCLGLAVALISACADDPASPPPDPTAEIGTYTGTWTQNGTSGTLDATKILIITPELAYDQTVREYETTAKSTLASIKTVAATVTDITIDDGNADYETLFIEIRSVRLTPKSSSRADEWNTAAFGGITTWVPDETRVFDSANPGTWEFGDIWLHHVAVSVRREGDLLTVNERGGFDGEDPPEDVYFLGP